MRILSVDYGKKRTGLAVTDPMQIIAGGLVTVATSELLSYIKAYCEKEPVETGATYPWNIKYNRSAEMAPR